MIAIGKLTKTINDGLNAIAATNDFPFAFFLQSEGGEYVPTKRQVNDVAIAVNGITKIVDSSVIPTQSVSVSTVTVELQISYPLPDDIPAAQAIEPVRAVLNTYFTQTWMQEVEDEENNEENNKQNKKFAVSSYASIPTTGSIALTSGPGLMCTFSCHIYYNFIEDGVNSTSVTFSFEGTKVPYTDATVTRVPVMTSVPYSDTGGVAEAVTESTALNIEFSAPTLKSENNALFTAYNHFLLTGDNPAKTVTITYEGKETIYHMKFGQIALSLEGVKNGNSRISLIEARKFING